MHHSINMRYLTVILCILTFQVHAAPVVGNKAAEGYFKKRKSSSSVQARKRRRPVGDHLLMFHLGGFLKDDSYAWGGKGNENIGDMSMGLTYQMGEWVNSTDFMLRIDFSGFELPEGKASKMTIMPMITFPDAKSNFPLYFGGGVGVGIFYKQVGGESNLSLDYSLLAGLKFNNVFENMGVFVESGVKNHVLLLSTGQFNSVFLNAGTIFSF